jgi:hypothetical protein
MSAAKRSPHPSFDGFSSPSYTQVPDELFDALMPSLGDGELRVLLYIIRRTFGFKRDADAISLSQMVSGITTRDGRVLDHGTGLSKATVARGLKGLRDKGIILAERHSSPERGHEATSYRLKFRTDKPRTTTMSQPRDTGTRTHPVSISRQALSHPQDTQQTGNRKTDFESSNEKLFVDETEIEQGSTLQATEPQPDQNRSPSEMGSIGTILQHRVRRDVGMEDRKAISVVIERFADQLGDKAETKASVSRALNLFQASGASRDGFVDVLFEASGEVKDRRANPGKSPMPRNQMAYFFAVVEDRLGLKDAT